MLLGRRACSGAGKGARRHVPIDLRRPQNLAGPPWRGWPLASLLRRHVAPTARRVDCLRERILSLPMVGAILDLKKTKLGWRGRIGRGFGQTPDYATEFCRNFDGIGDGPM